MDQRKLTTFGMSQVKENKISLPQNNRNQFASDVLQQKSENSSTKADKRKRRGKADTSGRDFVCKECEKAYLSMPALMQHRKTKHNFTDNSADKRGRGRPRKIVSFLFRI